ncbi:MAG TPA: hypothetical protein VMT45_14960 [Thermoanaerobaculaceae bacterium]|nr:hypothetical protein [Thermoanaerobaculaceae bacterium]
MASAEQAFVLFLLLVVGGCGHTLPEFQSRAAELNREADNLEQTMLCGLQSATTVFATQRVREPKGYCEGDDGFGHVVRSAYCTLGIERVDRQGRVFFVHANVRGEFSFPSLGPGQYLVAVCEPGGVSTRGLVVIDVRAPVGPLRIYFKRTGRSVSANEESPAEVPEGVHVNKFRPTPVVMSATPTEACGTSFTLPEGWVAWHVEPPPRCFLGLVPPDYDEFVERSEAERDAYPITLEVAESGIEGLAEAGGFTNRDGTWWVRGRAFEERTGQVEGPGWRGFVGSPLIGVFRKEGGYGGLGETRRALVIGPNGRGAVLNVSVIEYFGIFDRILKSFRFTEGSHE